MTDLNTWQKPGKRQRRELACKYNEKPLLSVIAANYNYGAYTRECLGCILNQTLKDLEIIVSDNGSTDDSPQIIRDYEIRYPGRVRGIYTPSNG
jgi:glycosyltransferase involved in cell wall biosynthesis